MHPLGAWLMGAAVLSSITAVDSRAAGELTPMPAAATPTTVSRDPATGGITLEIPDRGQAADAPAHGWCGEAAIQQALLFAGRWLPQDEIHAAGHAHHQDLHASDLRPALERLGMEVAVPPEPHDLDAFLRWIEAELEQEHPVLAGVKLYPTAHPEWSVDHFVLVVGADDSGLTLNTTWREQRRLTFAALASTASPLAFANAFHTYFALSIRGPRTGDVTAPRARLIVTGEGPDTLDAVVVCDGLTVGREMSVRRAKDSAGDLVTPFTATGPAQAFRVKLPVASGAAFTCSARAK